MFRFRIYLNGAIFRNTAGIVMSGRPNSAPIDTVAGKFDTRFTGIIFSIIVRIVRAGMKSDVKTQNALDDLVSTASGTTLLSIVLPVENGRKNPAPTGNVVDA